MRYRILAAAAAAVLLLATVPALANWPTTDWVIGEELDESIVNKSRQAAAHIGLGDFGGSAGYLAANVDQWIGVWGDRAVFAALHEGILESASRWYESLGFPAPYQWTSEDDLSIDEAGESYRALLKASPAGNASSHSSGGRMLLTTNSGFLTADTPIWRLMRFSAVHELYHAIQKTMVPSFRGNQQLPAAPGCRPGDDILDWLVEGTAAAVQIRWIEGRSGVPYTHPFKGGRQAAWVRYFDQPLHHGTLPDAVLTSKKDAATRRKSWACDYGSWYFWYAMGEMLGRSPAEKTAYTRYLFAKDSGWSDGGLANVDAGLKAAAAAYDAIKPYRGGLHDLYPQFVAQYLDDPDFYQHVTEVELQTPGYYEATSKSAQAPAGQGLLEPLATRAWHVRVHVPVKTTGPRLYTVRFTLEAQQGTDRDDLHLIVDRHLAGKPAHADTTYTWETQIAPEGVDDGVVEYLVRIANVARDVAAMNPAAYKLKVEVEGYYGGAGAQAAEQVSGALPPGFDVQGPDELWRCGGDAQAQARFSLLTTDVMAQSLERAPAEFAQSMENTMDQLAVNIKRMQKMGVLPDDFSMEKFKAERAKAEQTLAAHQSQLQHASTGAADTLRSNSSKTMLRVTLVGTHNGQECQMTLNAQWPGGGGGGRVVQESGPNDEGFGVGVFPAKLLHAMRNPSMGAFTSLGQSQQHWRSCMAVQNSCPQLHCVKGALTLEHASKKNISGSFHFDIVKDPDDPNRPCPAPGARRTVTGHFNVTSTVEDSGMLLDVFTSGRRGFSVPGAPFLLGDD